MNPLRVGPPTQVHYLAALRSGVTSVGNPWIVVALSIVAVPLIVFMRLTLVLRRGYADVANPRGIRLNKTASSTGTDVKPIWIVALVSIVFLLWLLVA